MTSLSMKQVGVLAVVVFVLIFFVIATWDDLKFLSRTNSYPLSIHHPTRIVVSMTTFASRIQLTALNTIDHIMKEDFDRIIITIPMKFRNESGSECNYGDCVSTGLKATLTLHEVRFLFEIQWGNFTPVNLSSQGIVSYQNNRMYLQFLLDRDYGPATKVLGALLVEKDPTTVLITMDDDVLHKTGLVHALATLSQPDAVLCPVCQMGSKPHAVHDGSPVYWITGNNAWLCPGWVMGVRGVAYRVGMFQPDVFEEAQQLSHDCFVNDDVWLSGYLKKRSVPIFVLPVFSGGAHSRHSTLSLSVIPNAQSDSLLQCAKSYYFD
jgi:hypothetical protein